MHNYAFKFDHDKVFKSEYRTLDELITAFIQVGFEVFNDDISFETFETEDDGILEIDNPTAEQYLEGKNPELVTSYTHIFTPPKKALLPDLEEAPLLNSYAEIISLKNRNVNN